jgi:uncharacterized DUF497 family protein
MISAFNWDKRNIGHIAHHQVIPEEAEELFEGRYYLCKTWAGRYMILGHSASGRALTCFFERTSRPGEIRIITARDMSDTERQLHKRKVG